MPARPGGGSSWPSGSSLDSGEYRAGDRRRMRRRLHRWRVRLWIQPTDQSTAKSLPGDPVAVTDSGQTAALGVPWKSASAPPPTHRRLWRLPWLVPTRIMSAGLLAMRNGKTDQAEWEFDAALEALLDTSLHRPVPQLLGEPVARRRSRPTAGSPSCAPHAARPGTGSPPRSGRADTRTRPASSAPTIFPSRRPQQRERRGARAGSQQFELPIVFNDQVKTFSRTSRPASGAWLPGPSSGPAAICP